MAGRGQTITADTAVVFRFISSLPIRCKSYNNITGLYILGKNQFILLHSHRHCSINSACAHTIAQVGGLPTHQVNVHAKATHSFNKLLSAINNFSNYLTGN